jgi:hypothetical protein
MKKNSNKSTILTYAAEDGLVLDNCLAYVSPIVQSPESFITQNIIDETHRTFGADITFDLYPIHTILVTVGWNKNKDVFLPNETWAARFTPEDKPFNIGHRPREIIGHITANAVVDNNLKIVDAANFEDLPDIFHILTSAVIYRHISSIDEKLEEEAAKLIEEISNGDWYVSMESLFTNFDYGVCYASGEQQLITRNKETAFLTKHLSIYGGLGKYNGGDLGRVLRNITFSGKGLVKKPANPNSVIFNDTFTFSNYASHNTINQIHGEEIMANEEKYVTQLEAQVKALQGDLASANTKIDELGEAHVKATVAEKDRAIEDLSKQLQTVQEHLDATKAKYNEAIKSRDELATAKEDVTAKLTQAEEKLAQADKLTKSTNRVSLLVDKGIAKADAEVVVADFDSLNDEQFAKIVELKASANKVADTIPDETEDKPGEANANATDINTAEPEKDINLGSTGNDETKNLMSALSAFLDDSIHGETEDDEESEN